MACRASAPGGGGRRSGRARLRTLAWAGAAAQGASSSRTCSAANTLPAALLFLGAGALRHVRTTASAGITYGVVGVTFVWWTLGSLLDVPGWLLALSPFHDVGLVPGEPFKAIAAVIMVTIGVLAAIVAVARFRQRDLIAA